MVPLSKLQPFWDYLPARARLGRPESYTPASLLCEGVPGVESVVEVAAEGTTCAGRALLEFNGQLLRPGEHCQANAEASAEGGAEGG